MDIEASSLGDFLDFPSPKSNEDIYIDPVRSGEHISLTMSDSQDMQSINGHLMRFDIKNSIVDIVLQDDWDFTPVKFQDISFLTLTRPRKISESDEVIETITVKPYSIKLANGDSLNGKTLSSISNENGIFLYPIDKNHHYTCLFVPRSSFVKDIHFGSSESLSHLDKVATAFELIKQENKIITSQDDLMKSISGQPNTPQIKLGQLLLKEKLISDENLKSALDLQKKHPHRPLGKILTQMGLVSDDEIQLALTRKLAIPYVDLDAFELDHELTHLLPTTIIRKHHVIPIFRQGNNLVVALANPLDKEAISDIKFNTKLHVEPVMASPAQLEKRINEIYGAELIDFSLDDLEHFEGVESGEIVEDNDEVGENDNTILRLANKIILDAYRRGASDIHIEPYPHNQKAIVRFRVDGVLTDYFEVPANLRKPLVARYKIMAGLDISEKRKPQDGKINFKRYSNVKLELRVATLPTVGDIEDVVLRLLADSKPKPIEDLGLSKANQKMLEHMLEIPYGLVLVCGPTGSGKTTTLHSLLAKLNSGDRKIWTAEDPVEITQRGLRQVQVNPKIDFTFAKAMRSFLRADPDIIMVGEMRDKETAAIGIEASLTGHLVLSTLHTNSAPESIVRLLDMGMDPFNFAYSLIGVVAQRLARTLCKDCKREKTLTLQELFDLALEYRQHDFHEGMDNASKKQLIETTIKMWRKAYGNAKGEVKIFTSVGCEKCEGSGYSGRMALHEVLTNNDELRRLIRERASVTELQHQCISHGMLTLKQDGIMKVLSGATDMLQVRKVCIT